MQRVLKTVLVVVLAAGMALPPLFFNRDPEKSIVIENKQVAAFPQAGETENWIADFENWWNDNIGFRDAAIVANLKGKYALFGKCDIPNRILGQDGNLFFYSEKNIREYNGYNPMPDELCDAAMQNLLNAQGWLADHGTRFLVAAIPDKAAVYPELYPSTVVQAPTWQGDAISQLVRYCQQHSDLDIVYLQDALVDAKADGEMLYYRNYDASHWNANGAFHGAQEILKMCQPYAPDIALLRAEDYDIQREAVPQDPLEGLRQLAAYIVDAEDWYYSYELKDREPVVTEKIQRDIEIDARNQRVYANENAGNNRKLVVVGDSYMTAFTLSFLAEQFAEVHFVRTPSAADLETLVLEVRPDFVLFEHVNRVYENYTLDFWGELGH